MTLFHLEWSRACRRSRHHLYRTQYLVLLVAELAFFLVGWADRAVAARGSTSGLLEIVRLNWFYFQLFTWQHFILLVVLAPALVAGSISDEKARGTLTLLLTTQLSAGEIVLGKWLGQVAQVVVFSLTAAPLIFLFGFMSGLSVVDVGLLLVESYVLLMALAAGGLLASVWSRRTTRAVLFLYVATGLLLLGVELAGWGDALQRCVLYPVLYHAERGPRRDWLMLLGSLCVFTVACLALASWRLRPVLAAELVGAVRKGHAWFERPPPSDQPLRWKERYVGELGLLDFARRLPTWSKVGAVGLVSLAQELGPAPESYVIQGIVFLIAVPLIVGIRCSGLVTAEREKETWTSLVQTQLEPRQIVRGKLWGVIDSVRPYMAAYFFPAFIVSCLHGQFLLPIIVVVSWLVTWVVLYYMAANGIYWSVVSSSSVSALVKTLATALREGVICMLVGTATASLPMILFGCFCFFSAIGSSRVVMVVLPILAAAVSAALYLMARSEESLHHAELELSPPIIRRERLVRLRDLPR